MHKYDGYALVSNLKSHLEAFNKASYSYKEFVAKAKSVNNP